MNYFQLVRLETPRVGIILPFSDYFEPMALIAVLPWLLLIIIGVLISESVEK